MIFMEKKAITIFTASKARELLKDGRFTQNPDDENIEYWNSEPEAFSYGCLISQNGFIDFNVINMKNDKNVK